MAKRGRKPAPNPLKILAGAQPCRINAFSPDGPAGTPEPPAYLGGAALEMWAELAPLLAGMRVLTLADRHGLALVCDTFRWWREEPGDAKRRESWRKLLAEFGLTPSSRSSLKVRPEAPKDKLAELLARRKV